MSLIYEALQRAETERAGKPAAISATELLRKAEQQARMQRRAESPDDAAPPLASSELTTAGSHGLMGDAEQTHLSGEKLRVMSRISPGNFETLHLSHPLHSSLVALADKESPAAEAFRLLGVRLRHLRRERSLRRLLICSTITQEGKSLISANLGYTIANGSNQNVLLIDGDVRRPTLTGIFGVDRHPGLCEYLTGERDLKNCVYRIEEANLWIMPAGTGSERQTELIHSDPLPGMLDELGESFQWIIIDSPPVLPLADTSIWARHADSVLLVTRNGITQKSKLERGLEAIDNDKLVGAVINSAMTSSEHDYYYYRSSSESPTSQQQAS